MSSEQSTDIAAVLRDYLDGNPEARGQVEFVDASDLRDAATEIERLRLCLKVIADYRPTEGIDYPPPHTQIALAARHIAREALAK